MRRIVLGTDGSAGSLAAAEWCATVARATSAAVTVAHAVTAVVEWDAGGAQTSAAADSAAKELLEGEWTAPLHSLKTPVQTSLTHDSAAKYLLRIAEHDGADLIVMGRRNHPPWTLTRLGSVAHTVLHDARCPVAIVPQPRNRHAASRPWAGALVGVDGSPSSLAGLRFGLEHTTQLGLELQAVYVVEPHSPRRGPIEVAYDDEDGALVGASAALARLVAEESADFNRGVSHDAIFGSPGDQLSRASSDAELLIVGNVQRGTLGEMIHGSTSHYCAAHASCPVVLVPAERS